MDSSLVFSDPFFRAIVKSHVDGSIARLATKTQIQVPTHLGRTMFGVIDETGLLEYGQVFVQYTNNISIKHPSESTEATVLKGKVMVTKFPATVGGDVRMLEAVDIPQLHHMQDVVVFPRRGPRPHPDEMAGSDLDGDEYAVIWDTKLFLERSEQAFDYCSEKPRVAFQKEEMDKKFREHFVDFMVNENVGQIANSHLHQSDQFGLDSKVSQLLAKKSAISLDFSKSGVAPGQLTFEWKKNGDPPERSERQPDYWVCQTRYSSLPMYTSTRLLGRLSRELRVIKDVIEESVDDRMEVHASLFHGEEDDGFKAYVKAAESAMRKYNSRARYLMDNNGIRNEAELFSGCYRHLRSRISDTDDRSSYNREAIIENKFTQLWREVREDFFEEFRVPGTDPNQKAFMRLTQPLNDWSGDEQDDVLQRVCTRPTEKMMAKARAYYKVCYESNNQNCLSFAWIAYDILNYQFKLTNAKKGKKIPETLETFGAGVLRENCRRNCKDKNDHFVSASQCCVQSWIEKTTGPFNRDTKLMEEHFSRRFKDKLNSLELFRYLSSRRFLRVDCVEIEQKHGLGLDYDGYHQAARVAFFKLILNPNRENTTGLIKEGYPFVVDLPKGTDIGRFIKCLREKSNCVAIAARLERTFKNNFDRFLLSSHGTIVANNRLRDLVSVKLPSNWPPDRDMKKEFAMMCYKQIIED